MKKFYLFLTAMLLSLSAVAQTSIKDFYGDWTFTFLDNNDGGKQVTMVLELTYEDNAGEYVFLLPDSKGLLNVYNSSYNADTQTLALIFQPWGYSYITVNGYKTDNTYIYASYNGDNTSTSRAFVDYNVATKKISNLKFNYGTLGQRDTNSLTFTGDYTGAENGSFNLTLVSMQYGAAEGGDNNSISVSISPCTPYATSLETAGLTTLVDVTSTGFDDYDVYYNIKLDNNIIVDDTKISPDGGDYIISVDNLSFERTYTLNVWAESGEYKSAVASQEFSTGWAPDIKVDAKAENVTNTSATISVTTNYWDITYEPLNFTILAQSATGPAVENITIDGKGTGTFELTGLTGNTDYVYSISYSATDEIGMIFEKQNAASVSFTTLAPTIELEGISYTAIPRGAEFTVENVVTEGLAADATVDVYFQLQGSDAAPVKAQVVDNKYQYTFSELEGDETYTAVIFAGVGEYNSDSFVKGTEYTEEFTTGAAEPQITITFPEGSYTLGIVSRDYASITATPEIVAENVTDYSVFYNLYWNTTNLKKDVQVAPTNGKYVITIDDLNFDRDYKLEVYATAGETYTSETAVLEFKSLEEPGVKITSALAENVTETTATLNIEYETVGITSEVTYTVSATSSTGPQIESITTAETSVSFNLTGLTPGTWYTYNIGVTATDENGKMYMKYLPVSFQTEEASQSIELDGISYSQVNEGAAFIVKTLNAVGFDDDTEFDVYFQLQGSDAAPAKGVLVTNGDEKYYEYTFNNLSPLTPYTAIIFGGVGEYGSDSFFKGKEYKQNFVSGQSGVDSIITDEDSDVRYFNLQGVEIKNPAAGTICIKVEGNKAVKIVK